MQTRLMTGETLTVRRGDELEAVLTVREIAWEHATGGFVVTLDAEFAAGVHAEVTDDSEFEDTALEPPELRQGDR